MVTKRRDHVPLTTLGQLAAKDLERPCGFLEKLGRRLYSEPSGVRLPHLQDARVDFSGRCR